MTHINDEANRKQKLQHIVELLKLALTLNDDEITKSTIESVIEMLQEFY